MGADVIFSTREAAVFANAMRRALGPALRAVVPALPVLTDGGSTAFSAPFFAFAMYAEAASLAIAAAVFSLSMWA